MGILSFQSLICLSRSGTIRQDEVEEPTYARSYSVFKADEGVKDSTCNHIINLSMSWKDKNSFAVRLDAYYF